MRLKISLVAVLALVVQAQGASVSPSEAASAVRGWAASGEHLGVNFRGSLDLSSGAVETTAVHTASSGAVFYTVKFKNGCGTVFVSGDTELEPVISFTASDRDYSTRDGSPLWILLDGDISTRKAVDGAADKWRRYWAADPEKPRLRGALQKSEPTDLRVAPLVKSKWNQAGGIYNYYTPNNYVCGCVATMMAQIMRYHHGPVGDGDCEGGRGVPLPTNEVAQTEFACTVDGVETNIALQGGTYVWDNMPLNPGDKGWLVTEERKQNIGKLTSDCGISVGMDYSQGVSGALGQETVKSFINVFGYSQATWSYAPTVDTSIEDETERARDFVEKTTNFYQRTLYANFDAGFPCELAISKVTEDGDEVARENGHAVVADGYGFEGDEKVPYVHLNMGWSGTDDVWYNLPDIGTGFEFNTVEGVGFNIFPVEGGLGSWGQQPTHSILSGRVLDNEGAPKGDCTVTIYEPGTLNVVTTLTTNAKGIWAAILPNGWLDGFDKATYDVAAATEDKAWYKMVEGVELERANVGYNENYICGPDSCGNSWGNDLVLEHPSVRVGDQIFSTVDNGIIMARMKAEESEGPVAIEVLDTTWLKRPAVIDFDCVMFATNSEPQASFVTRLADDESTYAYLTVARKVVNGTTNSYSLVMSNIVFAAEKGADTLVNVQSNCSLSISGTVDFGVGYKNAAVKTADEYGFRLLGPIDKDCGFTLSCATATEDGDVVGFCRATDSNFEALTNSVLHIANFADATGESRASVQYLDGDLPPNPAFNYKLVWSCGQPVPFEDAVAYYVDTYDTTNTAGRLDVLLGMYEEALENEDLPDDPKIVIRKDDTLSRPLAVGSGSLSIVGEDVEVSAEPTAGFTVTGGALSVSGVSFSDYTGNALFLVNGAELSLSNVAFSAVGGTNKWSGAVTVLSGAARVEDSTFSGCRATGKFSSVRNPVKSFGGAMYVAAGGTLVIRNSTIENCNALTQGGAIYADTNSVVAIGGELQICQNTEGSGTSSRDSDIYLRNVPNKASGSWNRATLQLMEPVTNSHVGVCWGENEGDGGYGNTNGLIFAVADSFDIATNSVGSFFSDFDGSLLATTNETFCLCWTSAPSGPQPCDPSVAQARVEGGESYQTVADAITAVADGEATIYITKDCHFLRDDIVVAGNITLASDPAATGPFRLMRSSGPQKPVNYRVSNPADGSIIVESGASLTIKDIVLYGCEATNDVNEVVSPVADEYGNRPVTTKPLIDVRGGSLTLATPSDGLVTEIVEVYGGYSRNAGAISVWGGGAFAMESGAAISNCVNRYVNKADGSGRGGALLVDDGEAVFTGGTITGCAANNGGGVFIGNGAVVKVSGNTVISGNKNLEGKASNLVVCNNGEDGGCLILDGNMTGSIGCTEGVSGNASVFGSVADGVGDSDALAASAHKFTRDSTGDVGMAVTNGESRLLVWSAALDDDGKYVDGNDTYELADGEPAGIDFPQKVEGLAYDGAAKTGVVESVGFTVTGNVATNAGNYEAQVALRPGFAWNSSPDTDTVPWEIGKGDYDTSGFVFENKVFQYDGKWHRIEIEGELPDGVSVTYDNNRRRETGSQPATAHFTGDEANYNAIGDKTATLTIAANEEPDSPEEDPPEALPSATAVEIACSIVISTSAIITVSNVVENCWYSLYEANSPAGVKIDGVDPVSRRRATHGEASDKTMAFERPKDAGSFFRVIAEDENRHTWPDDEY